MIGFLFVYYFTVRIRIVFVPPVPTGTPATITMLSPDSTRPECNATFSATSNMSSVEAGFSVTTGITPQLSINDF
nr:MAG TPA: hypothetical protein [Caudoviricetes sp.]